MPFDSDLEVSKLQSQLAKTRVAVYAKVQIVPSRVDVRGTLR